MIIILYLQQIYIMEYNKERIKQAIAWKLSEKVTAKRLKISTNEYQKHKKRYYNELRNNHNNQIETSIDINNNTAKYSGLFGIEPKTPEEIMELLKIDTKEWKLSQYWNKQMGDHWRVSALVTKLKENDEQAIFKNLLDNWEPKVHKITSNYKPNSFSKTCGVLSIQDIHFGKDGNDTVDEDFENAVIDLITRASNSHNIERLYFVIGGDLINMDSFDGLTSNGTPVDNGLKPTEAYIKAFDAMHWAISYISNYCKELVVIYVPGNHDRLSSFHLVHALSKSISGDNITWDIEYAERKVHVYGNNFNAFEHGDVSSKNTPLVYATEFSKQWGSTRYRTLFTGHYHQNKKVEYITTSEEVGFMHRTLPSLSKTDYYHYHNKYVGNKRAAILEMQCPDKGKISEFVYNAS